jgi:S1-C subfamily serine protease
MHLLLALLLLLPQSAESQKPKPADLEQFVAKIVVLDPNLTAPPVSVGTCFFVGQKGNLVASAAHVYLEAGKTMIDRGGGVLGVLKVFRDGKRVFAPLELVAADYAHDVAILRFDPAPLKQQYPTFEIKTLELDGKTPDMGDSISFVGYFGGDDFPLLSRTTIAGFTSAPPAPRQIILDLPANPGQSGSPVLSADEKVIGVLSSFVPVILAPGGLPTHSGLSRSVEVVHLKKLIESAEVR